MRELPADVESLSSTDVASLRRAYTTGIKRHDRAEKQLEDCMKAVEVLATKAATKVGKPMHGNCKEAKAAKQAAIAAEEGLAAAAAAAAAAGSPVGEGKVRNKPGPKPGGRKRRRELALQQRGEAATTATAGSSAGSHPAPSHKKKKPAAPVVLAAKPPHMLRDPVAGEAIAAKVASHELWILAVVLRVHARGDSGSLFVAKDIDSDRTYTLPRLQVLTLPHPAEVSAARWVVPNVRVMAMFPDTTSFYPALVGARSSISPEEGGVHEESAGVFFDEDEDDLGEMPERVVPLRFITLRE